jgi:hypothetical protein
VTRKPSQTPCRKPPGEGKSGDIGR